MISAFFKTRPGWTKPFLNCNGFTLPELLIAMAISGIIIAGIVGARLGQQQQSITQQQAVDMQQTVRAAMFLMTSEMRLAGFDPDGNANVGILTAGDLNSAGDTFSFSYIADWDGIDNDDDGAIDESGELATLTYTLEDHDGDGDNDITIDYGSGAVILAENISNLTFVYQDSDNAVTAVPDDIRSIQITVTAITDTGQLNYLAGNNTRSLTSTVKLRNQGL